MKVFQNFQTCYSLNTSLRDEQDLRAAYDDAVKKWGPQNLYSFTPQAKDTVYPLLIFVKVHLYRRTGGPHEAG